MSFVCLKQSKLSEGLKNNKHPPCDYERDWDNQTQNPTESDGCTLGDCLIFSFLYKRLSVSDLFEHSDWKPSAK